MSFDPVVQLRHLLGPKPNHPWGALLPQILVWCFRRFCVEKLLVASDTPLTEQLWDDHMELIHMYAPKGLDTVSGDWFTPENVEYMNSSLEEYNVFFIDCLVAIDEAMETDNPASQDRMSEFLDEEIPILFRDWLEDDYRVFCIFPMREEDDDAFTHKQMNMLIQSLMEYSETHPMEEQREPEPEPEPLQTPEPSATQPSADTEQRDPPPSAGREQRLPPQTISSAIAHRRMTLCKRPRDRSTRGKTRRRPLSKGESVL